MGYVELKVEDGIAIISIKRPRMNKLNRTVLRQFRKAVAGLVDNEDVRGVIVTGTGSTFSHGADMQEISNLNYIKAKEYSQLGQEALLLLNKIEQPVIAAINGNAIGPGLELALACDMRMASKNAELQHPARKFGLNPCFGGTVRLTKVIGRTNAIQMIDECMKIDAEQAHMMGLVDYLVDKDNLIFEAKQLLANEEISKTMFRKEDFIEEREAFARSFCDLSLRKKLKKKA